MALKVGQKVKFRLSHNKETELTGKVKVLHEDGKSVDVLSDANNGSVARIYTTHVDDCQVFKADAEPTRDETPAEERERETAEEHEEEQEDRQP